MIDSNVVTLELVNSDIEALGFEGNKTKSSSKLNNSMSEFTDSRRTTLKSIM